LRGYPVIAAIPALSWQHGSKVGASCQSSWTVARPNDKATLLTLAKSKYVYEMDYETDETVEVLLPDNAGRRFYVYLRGHGTVVFAAHAIGDVLVSDLEAREPVSQ
jgi:hypothetical protein